MNDPIYEGIIKLREERDSALARAEAAEKNEDEALNNMKIALDAMLDAQKENARLREALLNITEECERHSQGQATSWQVLLNTKMNVREILKEIKP